MTDDEFFTEMRRRRWQEPFEPFVIELADGERVVVTNPNGLAFSEKVGMYHDPTWDGPADFSSGEVVRIVTRPPAVAGRPDA